jgi:plasmid stability protein
MSWNTRSIMANLTVVIDDEVLRRARVRAAERGTSVNAAVAEYLTRYAGASGAPAAVEDFFDIADAAGGGSGEGGRTWTRDELYDRPRLR